MDRLDNEQQNEYKPLPPAQNGELDDQVKEESSKALEKENKMKHKKIKS